MIEDMRPGRYLTRNGILVTVSESNDTLQFPFYWVGYAADEIEVWDRHGRYYINGKDSPLDLVARLPDETPADDRIERALQVLREAIQHPGNADGWSEGWEMVSDAVQILESTP
jgi:hypothetical protein